MQNVQYATPCTDALAAQNTPEGIDARADRGILTATTLVRCQTGPQSAASDEEDNASELLVLPPDPLPGQRITIVPLPERSIGLVPHDSRVRTHTINNLPMENKRIAVYSYVSSPCSTDCCG